MKNLKNDANKAKTFFFPNGCLNAFWYTAKNKVDLTTDLRAFSRPFELHLILFDMIRKDSLWFKNCSRMFFRARRKFLNILDSQFTRTKQII